MIEVPPGYRIERHEEVDRQTQTNVVEVTFTIYEPADAHRRVTTVSAYNDRRFGWVVNPGGSVNRCEPNEARARAAALLMAAAEVERRN